MIVTRATMTGADESVSPKELFELSMEYPYVEWGILVSQTKRGASRYPNSLWVKDLYDFASKYPMNLSVHVCGSLCRDILVGSTTIIGDMGYVLPMFQRMQLNFNSQYSDIDYDKMIHALCDINKMFIFQVNTNNKSDLVLKVRKSGLNAFPLFDASGGKGLSPKEWPKPIVEEKAFLLTNQPIYCGYAGGLGPDNIYAELIKIENLIQEKDLEIWVDMESAIRSGDIFDLSKVETCLKEIKEYTKYGKNNV